MVDPYGLSRVGTPNGVSDVNDVGASSGPGYSWDDYLWDLVEEAKRNRCGEDDNATEDKWMACRRAAGAFWDARMPELEAAAAVSLTALAGLVAVLLGVKVAGTVVIEATISGSSVAGGVVKIGAATFGSIGAASAWMAHKAFETDKSDALAYCDAMKTCAMARATRSMITSMYRRVRIHLIGGKASTKSRCQRTATGWAGSLG